MNEHEVKQIIEYVNDIFVSDHYGKWGALNFNQRKKIRDLCNSWLIINEHDDQMTRIIYELKNMFYEKFRINQNGSYTITESDYKDIEDKLKESE